VKSFILLFYALFYFTELSSVLLLNTCLTVRMSEANSHQGRGWEEFTDAVVKLLGQRAEIVYLLWGNPAQTKCKSINGSKNTVIMSSHPSPLGGRSRDCT
jgi:uracil-DNA glycosylase